MGLGTQACGTCGSPASLVCGGCGDVAYCSKDHQKAGWKAGHKTECKAYKIERQRSDMDTNSEEEPAEMPGLMPIARAEQFSDLDSCQFCGIFFKNSTMYDIHMSYHEKGPDPFKCHLCGDKSNDALSFFLHIAQKEHTHS